MRVVRLTMAGHVTNILQQGLHQVLADTLTSSDGGYGKILKISTFAVGDEHHQSQPDIRVAGHLQTLTLIASVHQTAEHIARWALVTNIKQGLKLLPKSQLQGHLCHRSGSDQLRPAIAAGSSMAREVFKQ